MLLWLPHKSWIEPFLFRLSWMYISSFRVSSSRHDQLARMPTGPALLVQYLYLITCNSGLLSSSADAFVSCVSLTVYNLPNPF
jgi:hypothetical protein